MWAGDQKNGPATLFIYRHNYGYLSGRSYCNQALGCCSISIAPQQLKVFLFPYTTNTFEAAAKVRVAPGHASQPNNFIMISAMECPVTIVRFRAESSLASPVVQFTWPTAEPGLLGQPIWGWYPRLGHMALL